MERSENHAEYAEESQYEMQKSCSVLFCSITGIWLTTAQASACAFAFGRCIIEIREYTNYSEEEILRLYTSVGWTAYTDCPDELKQGFAGSLLTLAAYEEDKLLGIIRTVGDGHTIVFIQDIWCFRNINAKGLVPPFCKLFWIDTAMCGKLSLQQTTPPKRLLFRNLWDFVKCLKLVAAHS